MVTMQPKRYTPPWYALRLLPALLVVYLPIVEAQPPDLHRAAVEQHARYAAELESLAKWCESKGLAEEARVTRRVLGPRDPYKLYIPILPKEVGPPKFPADASADAVKWDSRLWRLRRDHAAALYGMARRAARAGRAALAFDLAMAAIQANPDNESVRHLFGYQKYHDQWRTIYEKKKLRAGFVWSDKFGWLPKSHLSRYEQGQRSFNGRWISAAEDAEHHRDIRSGWDVKTEHYTIRTNHSIEAAVALGVKLERLNDLWRKIFVRYYASEADVLALFDGRSKSSPRAARRHDVVYFRDRDDYSRSLKAGMPNVEISIGAYVDRTRRAYFFAGPDSDDRTLYHEATHQLFHESRPVAPNVGRKTNFWIVEGVAMYMESLRREDGFYVLGGFDDERLHAAQYRLLHDHFYVPLGEFTGYGMEKIQQDPRIATLYSQAAGLAHFLIYHDGGRYRDAVVAYLTAVYTGRDTPETLSKLTGTSDLELDRQYREFLEGGATKTRSGK